MVARFNGYLQEWSGNSATACFGYPKAREDAAALAVDAGLGLAEAFGRAKAKFCARVGVDTSLAVADVSGVRPISAEGIEVARSLGQRAAANEVLVGPETRRLVEGRFAFGPETELTLPGGRRLRFAQALHASTARGRFQGIRVNELAPMAGRDQELNLLMRQWQGATDGHGHATLVGGPPGLGKSRMVHEVTRRVAADESAALIECYCAPQFANTMLYPLIDAMERLVFESDTRTMEAGEKLRTLEGWLAQLGFPLVEAVPLFSQLLNIPAPGYAPLEITPEKQRALTLEALVNIVVERASRQPLLFIVEDLQWADPTTLDMLALLLDRIPALQVLALYTHRPEFTPPWPRRSFVSEISLDRLSREDAIKVSEAAARGMDLDKATLDQIVSNSDGVPLFLEEVTRSVVETGSAGAKSGRMVVPASLRDSFIARLDQLGPARNVARMASILGREFPLTLLEAVSELPPEELKENLDQLMAAEILHVRGAGARRTYIFKHALLQEAARDSLLRKTRLTLHEQVAELMLDRFPEMAERQPEVIARHFTDASLGARAVPYWHRAGVAALQRSAHREALSHFRSGFEAFETLQAGQREPSLELLLLAGQGPALIATQGFGAKDVGDAYRRAEELLPTDTASPLTLPTLWGVWVYHLVRSDLEHALATSLRIVEMGERLGLNDMQLEGHWTAGNTLYWLGNLADSRQHLETAETLYDPARADDQAYRFGQDSLIGTLCYQSFTYCFQGHFARAMAVSDRSVEFARSLKHPFSIGWSLTFRATLECFLGNFAGARDWGAQAVQYCQEQAYPFWISAALSAWGKSLAELGDVEGGAGRLRQGIEMSRAIGSRVIEPLYRGQLAETLLRADRAEEALAEVEGAITQAQEQRVGISRLDLLRIRGVALAAVGRAADAEESLRRSLEESRTAGCRYMELLAACNLTEICGDRGALTEVCEAFRGETGEPPILRRARDLMRK